MTEEDLVCFGSFYYNAKSKEDMEFYTKYCKKCKHLKKCKEETKDRENPLHDE